MKTGDRLECEEWIAAEEKSIKKVEKEDISTALNEKMFLKIGILVIRDFRVTYKIV